MKWKTDQITGRGTKVKTSKETKMPVTSRSGRSRPTIESPRFGCEHFSLLFVLYAIVQCRAYLSNATWQSRAQPLATGWLPLAKGGADARHCFRISGLLCGRLVHNPGFSVTSILSLTLGIGATVAVYSILYDAVLNPWPYAGIERISDVWLTDNSGRKAPGA